MITVVFAALFASVSASADTGTPCIDEAEVCTGGIAVPDGIPTCVVNSAVALPSGCDLEMPDKRLTILPSASITVAHDALIEVLELDMRSRVGDAGPAVLSADCGGESCGEVVINVGGAATFVQTDFAGRVSGATEGTSLRVVADGALTLVDEINVSGRGPNGVSGNAFFEAPDIHAYNAIKANGKVSGGSGTPAGGGTAGTITLHATNSIQLSNQAEIEANGQSAGRVQLLAAGDITILSNSVISARMGDPDACPDGCASGTVLIDGGLHLTANGDIDVSRGATSTGHGGAIWMRSSQKTTVGDTAQFHLGGGTEGASGTLRMDANDLEFSGTVHGALNLLDPQHGAVISFASKTDLLLTSTSNIDAGGDGDDGGHIELFSNNSLLVGGTLDAGSSSNSTLTLHSRYDSLVLGADISVADGPSVEATEDNNALIMDGCMIVFGPTTKVTTKKSIHGIARGLTASPTLVAWAGPGWSAVLPVESPSVLFESPSDDLFPTELQKTQWFGDYGAEFAWAANSSIQGCGSGANSDFDGDFEAWDRLGSGTAYSDCNDYDEGVYSDGGIEVADDGIDSNCHCVEPVDLEHAYAGFLYRRDQSIPAGCDNDVTTAPDTGEVAPETGAPPVDSGTPDATATDSGIIVGSAGRSDTVVRGCACAHGSASTGAWLGIGALFGLALRRRRGPVA